MKRFFFILFVFISGCSFGQSLVKGFVTEQNSNNKPIPGVQIISLGATPDISDNNGYFQLEFANKQPGDRLIISEIYKKGYEVVNKKEVMDNWIIPNNPDAKKKIVMCPEGLIAQNT
jgi:hypothetical protein